MKFIHLQVIKNIKYLHSSQHKTFIRHVVTNLLLLALAFLFGTIVFNIAAEIVERDIRESNDSLLRQSMDTMDQELSVVEMASNQISSNSEIENFAKKSVSDADFSFLDLQNAVNALANYQLNLNSSYIYDYFVYFTKSNYIVTPETCFAPDFYYNYEARQMNIPLDSWLKLLNSQHQEDLKSITMNFDGQKSDELAYIQSIPLDVDAAPNATLVILIKKSGINNLLSKVDLSGGGWFYILDKNGHLVTTYSKLKQQVKYLNLRSCSGSSGSYSTRINGRKMIINFRQSPQSQWKYVLVQPANVMMSELYDFERAAFALFMTALILCGFIACYIAYYNTKPIMNLANRLKSFSFGNKEREDGDEFNTINHSISALIDKNESLKLHVSSLARNDFVDRLLRGNFFNQEELNASVQNICMDVKKENYVVLALKVYGRNVIDGANKTIVAEINTMKVLLMETVKNYFGESVLYQNIDLQTMAVVLCLNKENTGKEQITQTLKDIFEEYLEHYRLKLIIGIGGITTDMLDVCRSYQEALDALDYVQLHRGGKIRWYDDIPIDSQGYYYPLDFEQRIINDIKVGDKEGLESIYSDIISENFNKRELSPNVIKALFYDIKGTVMKLIQQVPVKSDIYLEHLSRLEFDVSSSDNFNKLLAELKSICKIVSENRNDRYQALINNAIGFIKENYMKPEFGLCMVASKFNISESYLSYLFKKQTGRNFAECVEQLRIDEACKLLRESKLSINEIYPKIGYSNVQSFRRAFKRIKGASPKCVRNGTI